MPKELSQETIDTLIAQHGPNLETLELDYLDEPVVLRPPTSTEWRAFRDDTGGVPVEERMVFLAQSCVVWPNVGTINDAAKTRPALFSILGNQVAQLAGFQSEVKRKKLQRSSGTPK